MRQGMLDRTTGRHRPASIDRGDAPPVQARHLARSLVRHRAEQDRRRGGLVVVASLFVLVGVVLPAWLWQFRPFDSRHGFGSDGPPAGIGAGQEPLGVPPAMPGGHGGYVFMQLQADGTAPVAFDPCRPIHFVLGSAGLPDGGEALVREAADVMAAASGLRFVYDGLTDETAVRDRDPYQPERYGDRWAPVYVAFTTPAEIPGLAGRPIGLGGSTPRAARDGLLVYVSGSVWLERAPMSALLAAGRRDTARAVVEHEIGHVLGLNHVSDPSQLMSESGGAVSGPADGDRRGLALLGRGGCRPDL